jgi:hypothetical protein
VPNEEIEWTGYADARVSLADGAATGLCRRAIGLDWIHKAKKGSALPPSNGILQSTSETPKTEVILLREASPGKGGVRIGHDSNAFFSLTGK